MNFEENRLRSFTTTWPANTPVQPADLARNGFFATDNFLEAECVWCHARIADWQYGDVVIERHRMATPQCEFVLNSSATDNVPLAAVAANAQQCNDVNVPAAVPITQLDLFVEANRLSTFRNWPNANISPESLAKAGFFYLQRNDEVECVYCKGVMAMWEQNDNAFDEHKRFFPNCPRVQLGPLIEIASDGIRDLGIQRISPPLKPKYASLDARLRSYGQWPISVVQRPEALAQAGLYYQNVDDQVRCFHCNIGLRSWQKEDDPWFEHAKWYPQCEFVRLVKGVPYVERVQRESFLSNNINEAMKTVAVRQALEIGIDVGAIRSAMQRKLISTGGAFDNVDDLMRAVFGEDDEHDVEDEQLHRATSSNSSMHKNNNAVNAAAAAAVTMPTAPAAEEVELAQEVLPCSSQRLTDNSQINQAVVVEEEQQQQTEQQQQQQQPTAAASPQRRQTSLEEENRKLKDARLCKVCLDEEVGVVFLPCGHLVTCVQCAPGVINCPLCRTDIKGFVRTFLA